MYKNHLTRLTPFHDKISNKIGIDGNCINIIKGFPGGSDGKESACSAGDLGSIPALGIPPGEGNDNPLPYSCLENSMGRRAWWATVHGITKRWT